MSEEQIWAFIKNNVISLTTVLIGLIVLVLHGIGVVSPAFVASTTLALVALLSTSEIVERQSRLTKLENLLEHNIALTSEKFDELTATEVSAIEAHEHVRFLIMTAKRSVIWASPQGRIGSPSDTKRVYEDAVDHVVQQGQIQVKWLTCFDGKARALRAKKFIFDYGDNTRIFVGHLQNQQDFPAFPFLIRDEQVLFTRAPYTKGGRGQYFVINSSAIAELFLNYFDRLLENSMQLEPTESTREFLDSFIDGQRE